MADLTIDRTIARGWRLRRSGPIEAARTVLRADALLCLVVGAALVAAAPAAASLVDGEPTLVVRVIGAGLVLYAGDLWLMARARPRSLSTLLKVVAALNGAWLAATVAVLAAGVLSPAGAVVAVTGSIPVVLVARAELLAARDVRARLERYPEINDSPNKEERK